MLRSNLIDATILSVKRKNVDCRSNNLWVVRDTPSTMILAEEAALQNAKDGYTVIALRQSKGVGSANGETGERRVWLSPIGNLYMSMVVAIDHAKICNEHVAMAATYAAGKAARIFVKSQGMKLAWHWPNDLWRVEGDTREKFGGILALLSTKKDRVILGVGINIAVRPDVAQLPAGSGDYGVTTLKKCGANVTVGQFAQAFAGIFKSEMAFIRHYGFAGLLDKMGFAHSNVVRLQLRETGEEVSGRVNGYTVRDNQYIIHIHGRPDYHIRQLTGVAYIPL